MSSASLPSGLDKFYRKMDIPDYESTDKYYSMRYFISKGYFHSKCDEMTPEKTRIRNICPQSRLTSFCNGSVYFPYRKRYEVLKHISYDIQTDTPTYWNQRAFDVEGEGFRFVVDIDSDTRIFSTSEINKIAVVLWNTLREYYKDFADKPIEVFGSKCGPRMKKGKISTGLHFMCHVKVSVEEAMQLTFGFRMRLQKNAYINTNDIDIDGSIYKVKTRQANIRFIYSNKMEDCIKCMNITEKRMACTACDRRGILISKFTYKPVLCVNHTGDVCPEHFKKHHPDFLTIVNNHSLWPEDSDIRTDFKKPQLDPLYTIDERKEVESLLNKGKKRKRAETNKFTVLKVTNPSYELLEEFIRGIQWKGKRCWEGISIHKINVSAGSRTAQVFITGIGSTMCFYANKDHGTNRVWFHLNRSGVLTLHCNSKKVEYGCKSKDRIKFDVPNRISNVIFDIENPPGFGITVEKVPVGRKVKPTKKEDFNVQEFIRRKPAQGFNRGKHSREEKMKSMLKNLSNVYKLNQTSANSLYTH